MTILLPPFESPPLIVVTPLTVVTPPDKVSVLAAPPLWPITSDPALKAPREIV
jgi:hypothetical protein